LVPFLAWPSTWKAGSELSITVLSNPFWKKLYFNCCLNPVFEDKLRAGLARVDFVKDDWIIYESSKTHDDSPDPADAGCLTSLWFEACRIASLLPRGKLWYEPACGLKVSLTVDVWQNS
jgi:hypothetical protein